MGYVPNQRPGGPGSFNNWQGQYDAPAELPNVAGSTTQLGVPNVQAGDVAWVTGGTPGLYVCTDPAEGAAVWELVTTTASATSRSQVGPWNATLPSGTTPVDALIAMGPFASFGIWVPNRPGSIVGLSAILSEPLAGGDMTVGIYKNGALFAAGMAIAAGGTKNAIAIASGVLPYVAFDEIQLVYSIAPAIANTPSLLGFIEVEQ